mmetsp:Transcript_11238/g.27621  ORF Transcript_11238/g.27621 Transcript_11238/m.27621 type:complete len:347 (+) Transcript_11238:128-1168(+)
MILKSFLVVAISIAFPSTILGFFCGHVVHNNLLNGPSSCGRRAAHCSERKLVGSGSARALFPVVSDESYSSILPSSPKGVIFDMDGTLVQHVFDFADMRRRVYAVADKDSIGQDLERGCVLALADMLSCEGQEECKMIFDECERHALDNMQTMPGGVELVRFLRDNGLKRAVLTRNLEKNVPFMSDLYLEEMGSNSCEGGSAAAEPLFQPIVARDSLSHPSDEEPLKSKPHPDGILHICSLWGCDPSEVIMVGDNANDDITAANRAGCGGAVLLTQPGGDSLDTHSGYEVGDSEAEIRERTPSLRVESLLELRTCLEALLNQPDNSSTASQTKANSKDTTQRDSLL